MMTALDFLLWLLFWGGIIGGVWWLVHGHGFPRIRRDAKRCAWTDESGKRCLNTIALAGGSFCHRHHLDGEP
jgi:hypothetical protein